MTTIKIVYAILRGIKKCLVGFIVKSYFSALVGKMYWFNLAWITFARRDLQYSRAKISRWFYMYITGKSKTTPDYKTRNVMFLYTCITIPNYFSCFIQSRIIEQKLHVVHVPLTATQTIYQIMYNWIYPSLLWTSATSMDEGHLTVKHWDVSFKRIRERNH